ncbi:MAG: hypothetical protein CMJ78_03175 [Planctomycetaceae bacterium]|nr:hypothetical protein [Planctomycetaceae bacterium]
MLIRFAVCLLVACLLTLTTIAGILADDTPSRRPTKVTIDDDGFVRVNGKRRYLYGAFRDPSDSITEFAGLKQARFDLTHEYLFEQQLNGDVEKWVTRARTYLRGAEEHGVGVALGLPRDVVEDLGDVETARKLVEAVKNEPALWLWYLSDEPGRRPEPKKVAANLNKVYRMIKQVDPNHPVVICGTRAEFFSVNNADNADILWPNTYPVPDGPWHWTMSETSSYSARWPDKSVWSVSQAFDWRIGDRRNVITDRTHRPNAKEIRAQVHANIAAGARSSVFYWSPKRLEGSKYDIRKLPSIWKAVCDIGDELKVLEPVLLAPPPTEKQAARVRFERTVKEAGRTKDNVYHWQRRHNGSLYVGIVNAGHERRMKVTVELPFAFQRVMQYPKGLTVIQPNEDAELTIDYERIPVQFMPAESNSPRKLDFFMYECDTVVWRFNPSD